MTSPIVRFAPSPTGKLHVGNVRTALINWLFAKADGGKFILRIDDTDTERSTKEFEDGLREDLEWLGLVWDDTFSQSDRFDRYDEAANKLRAGGHLYACYETGEELDRMRKLARARGKPPVYDRSGLSLSDEEIDAYEAEGRKPHWRFKLSGMRAEWTDLVRGKQSVDTSSLSDPILIRGDGSYLYTLPSVVDDIDAGITHVVRGEDHVTNSGAQIEIFRALGGKPPSMAHTPLLVDKEGGPLSKRLGSLSMGQLRDQGLEPMAINSLLGRIGTSDNVEAVASLQELAANFSFDKIGRSSARFDADELTSLNAALLHAIPFDEVEDRLRALDPLLARSDVWDVIRENCAVLPDALKFVDMIFGQITPLIEDDDKDFIARAAAHLPEGEMTVQTWGQWTTALKEVTGRKGGALFMPLRKALTGAKRGPDMGRLLPLIGRVRVLERLGA